MTPYAQMAERYRLHPQERSFEWYIDFYFQFGFVFSTPDFFIMGGPCQSSKLKNGVSPLKAVDPREGGRMIPRDTWYIHAMAGNMAKAWSILPYALDWIAFERIRDGKRELQFVQFERIRRLSNHEPEPILAQA